MSKIITVEKAIKLSGKLKKEGKVIVLTGGCFDVLHLGHIKFIEAAKKRGDLLFIFVESDEKVRELKGRNRPINNQDERAQVLAAIQFVDYVIKIPFFEKNASYDKLITDVHPSIIAITKESTAIKHAQRQAQKIDAKVAQVISLVNDKSTSKIAKIITDENKL